MRKGTRFMLWTCVGLLFVGLIACEATLKSGGSSVTSGQTAAGERIVSAEEQKLDEEVFPKDRVVDVKITIDEADFQDMLDNASAEEFKTASVDYNGHHFDNIGIRTKGNLSLRSVVQMSDSDRYSFKLSFDEYVNQTLEGIQKINLNNNFSDATYMREFLTYELSEQMGLPTPKHSYVNVYINGELWGFYLAVEQIGDAYLERNFGNAYGALYKGEMTGSGSDLTWLGDDLSAYTGLVQKSKSSNGDILIKMLDELNNGSDYEKYINVPDALGYIALNTLTNNMDSYIGANKQNYYLYENNGIFSILPWDYNMAFGGMGGFGRGANGGAGAEDAGSAGDAPDAAT
ncbi:CotH kinase family protein, partial [Paenibacillus barengoltzii]